MSRNPTNSFLSVLCRLRQLLFTDFDHVYLLVSKTGCKNTKIFSESCSFMHFSFTSYCFFVVFTSEIYCLCHYRVQSNPRWRQEFAADRKRIQRGVTVKPVEFLLVPDFLILNRSLEVTRKQITIIYHNFIHKFWGSQNRKQRENLDRRKKRRNFVPKLQSYGKEETYIHQL